MKLRLKPELIRMVLLWLVRGHSSLFLGLWASICLLNGQSIKHEYEEEHFSALIERVRGRKARGPPMEETGCKCQTFFLSLLSGRRKQTLSVRFFSPSLHKIKRFLLKFWFHLNLTFLKPWANQCIFLMEMFFLSYANELCVYLRLCLSSSRFPRIQNRLDKPVCFTQQTSMF